MWCKLPQNIVMNLDIEAALAVQRKTLEALKDRMATLEMKVASIRDEPQKGPAYGTEWKDAPSGTPYALSFSDIPLGTPKREMTESGIEEM